MRLRSTTRVALAALLPALPAVALAVVLGAPGALGVRCAEAGDGSDPARIAAHEISIRFEPAAHSLVARDVLTVESGRDDALSLELAPGLAVEVVRQPAAPGTVVTAPDGSKRLVVNVPKGRSEVVVAYHGVLFDGVEKKEGLSWVVGDATRGLVSEKGVYLHGGTGWYPRSTSDRAARFDVTSYIPAPFLVVTQGRSPKRSTVVAPQGWQSDTVVVPPMNPPSAAGSTYNVSVAHSGIPTDSCDLVAGPYEVKSRTVEGIEVSTYFQPAEAPDAGLWLDAADEVVRRYEPILGSYPHSKFDVVENFFSTGYGMPSFTLLGDDVIRYVTQGAKAPGGKIPPGYLDHEYVHGWFGNGLFVDPGDGNWCEALTSYFSNYLAKEFESKEAGAEHRRGVLEKYAIRISAEKDYPVRAFQTKTEDKDNDIGYGKGSLIFHVLRKRLGDAQFFERVKAMASDKVGLFVTWTDWLKALDGEWAKPFLERKGLPRIRLASATAWPVGPGKWMARAEATVEQPRGEEPWPDVDLDVDVNGKPVGKLHLSGKSGVWRGEVAEEPKTIELDARYDAMRRIADEDLPMCLNATIAAGTGHDGHVLVRDDLPEFTSLAQRLAGEKGLMVSDDLALLAARHHASAFPPYVLLAVLPVSPHEEDLGGRDGKSILRAHGASFEIGGKTYDDPKHAVLCSGVEDGRPVTVFFANSKEAASRARMLGFYGWDQYVVFKVGERKPVARGFLDREPRGTRRAVVTDDAAPRVMSMIDRLASDEFEGRARKSPGHRKAEELLGSRWSERFTAAGKDLLADTEVTIYPFALGVAELTSPRDLVLTTDEGTEVLHDAFRPLAGSPEREGGRPLPYADGSGAVPAPGKWPDTSPEGLARLWRQLDSSTSAPAVMLAPTAATRTGLAPFLDTPHSLTPESEAELRKPGRDGKPRPRPSIPHWISGRRMRAFSGASPIRVPYLVLSDATIERLDRPPTIRTLDFAIRWSEEAKEIAAGTGGRNLVCEVIPRGAPKERPPVVVVSAHYDSFGKVDGGDGKLLRGADDNASGVAAITEAAEAVVCGWTGKEKVGLLVVYFDGEEWGLVGSHSAAERLLKEYDVRAVVNVDSVGRVRDDTAFVIGLSKHADLGKKAADALVAAGLKVGADIDKYAYEHGSDHWPFHEKGVPAITLWASDYGVMNTPDDNPDMVNPVGVARVARAVRGLLERLLNEP